VPARLVQSVAKAASDAARHAAQAADAAQAAARSHTQNGRLPGSREMAEASRDAARIAADAAHEAAGVAAEVRRLASNSIAEANGTSHALRLRAHAAAERAREALEESRDRSSAPSVSVAPEIVTVGLFERFVGRVQSEMSIARGEALLEERKYHEAREHFRKAVASAPENDRARALLGWSHYYLGEFREAIVTFKTTLRRQPTWEGLYNGLGWSRFRLGRHHLAIPAFRQATERNPDYVDAVNGLGSTLFELNEYEAALPLLEKALQGMRPAAGPEPPEAIGIRQRVGWSLYYLGRYRPALSAFIRASLATPAAHQPHVGMGWCYVKLDQQADARAAFRRALELRPNDQAAREGLRRTGG
jgi:tetratricopeptide (TPR) repeat protein